MPASPMHPFGQQPLVKKRIGSDQVRDWIQNCVSYRKDYGLSSTVRSIKSFKKVSSLGLSKIRAGKIAPEKCFTLSFVHLSFPMSFLVGKPNHRFTTCLSWLVNPTIDLQQVSCWEAHKRMNHNMI